MFITYYCLYNLICLRKNLAEVIIRISTLFVPSMITTSMMTIYPTSLSKTIMLIGLFILAERKTVQTLDFRRTVRSVMDFKRS